MTQQALADRVRAYLARQRVWLEGEILSSERLLAQMSTLSALEAPLAAAKTSMSQLEDLEREQRGLLAEWKDENIPPEEREAIQAEAAAIAELAARLGELRARVARDIAESQTVIVKNELALRAGRGGLRRYRPGLDTTADNIDRDA